MAVLLLTKFNYPQRISQFVPRPRLIELLEEGLTRKLTLVSAPAGYGKTTLVAEWTWSVMEERAKNPSSKIAWLSLDNNDNDPARFLRYLVAAFNQADGAIGNDAQSMFQSVPVSSIQQSPEAILTTLINEISQRPYQWVVVLDDYHLITNEAIHQAMTFWLSHMPSHVHVIQTSRIEPALPLARLRVQRQLVEITAQDLQFTVDEATEFLQKAMKLQLSPETVLQLVQRTEGWVASLQLAVLSLQAADDPREAIAQFTGSDRFLMDYLLEEVWQRQPESLQHFLMQTAVLKRFSAPLCDALTGNQNGASLLQMMDQRNLFVRALDNQREWYCYHPLFADFLQVRLKQLYPEWIQLLHHKASAWLATSGFEEEAIEHTLQGQNYDLAIRLIHDQARSMLWHQGRPVTFLRWCEQIPETILFENQKLTIYYMWAFIFVGKLDKVEAILARFVAHWDEGKRPLSPESESEIALLMGEIALHQGTISAALAWFEQAKTLPDADNQEVIAVARQAEGYARRLNGDVALAERALIEASVLAAEINNRSLWLFSKNDLAETYMIKGRLHQAHAIYMEIVNRFDDPIAVPFQAWNLTYIGLAALALKRNQLLDADDYAEKGLSDSSSRSVVSSVTRYGNLTLAAIKQAQGDWKTAVSLLNKSLKLIRQDKNLRVHDWISMEYARLCLMQGEMKEAEAWANQFKHNVQPEFMPNYHYHLASVVYGRYLLTTNKLDDALPHLQQLQITAELNQWGASLIDIHVLLAMVYQKRQQLDHALAALQAALDLADGEGFIRPFIAEGAPMADLLRLAISRGIAPNAVGKIQAAFMPAAIMTQPLLDPLTSRELEVLTLMADGMSNPEIANKLILATGTIAKYSNNIYSKLNVRNRTEAANRAKALGVID